MKRLMWFGCFLLASCSPSPPDVYVFENLPQHLALDPDSGHLVLTASPTCLEKLQESECGHGVSIVTGKELFIGETPGHWYNGKPWSVLKEQSVLVPAQESYAPLATYIINSCQKMGCNKIVDKFRVKLNSLNGIAGAIKYP